MSACIYVFMLYLNVSNDDDDDDDDDDSNVTSNTDSEPMYTQLVATIGSG